MSFWTLEPFFFNSFSCVGPHPFFKSEWLLVVCQRQVSTSPFFCCKETEVFWWSALFIGCMVGPTGHEGRQIKKREKKS